MTYQLGQKLRRLRELRAFSQADLAEATGLSQSTVARAEQGEADETTVAALVRTLGATESYLEPSSTSIGIDASTTLFRAHSSMRVWERNRAHRWAEFAMEAFLHLRQRARIPEARRLPSLDCEDIELAARQARRSLDIPPDTLIPNLARTLERHGYRVVELPLDGHTHVGFSTEIETPDGVEPVTFSFQGVPGDRRRFTLAHELGHLLLHGGTPSSHPDGPDPRILESQANEFAGAFLLPRQLFLEDLRGDALTLSTYVRLKPRWGVSIQAMIRRAHTLGRLSDWEYRKLNEELGSRGWRTREPAPLPPERPRQFITAAKALYGSPVDAQAFARDSHLPLLVIRGLVDAAGAEVNEERSDVVDLADARSRRRPTPGANATSG